MINRKGIDIEKHIEYRIEKVRSRLTFIRMRKLILPHISVSAATAVYKVFVRPILEFGIGVFDKMTNSNLHLQKLVN